MNNLIKIDEAWLLALNGLGSDFFDPFFIAISEVAIWFPLYAFLIFLIFRKFKTGDAIVFLALVILGVVLTDQISVHLFKEVFQRPRPCHQDHLANALRVVDGCGGAYGFVSSHAANTFGLATFVGKLLNKKIKYIFPALLIWATIVSYSRIYLGVHFPGDILGGAILGMIIGNILFTVASRRLI